jgi:hypothetical protein
VCQQAAVGGTGSSPFLTGWKVCNRHDISFGYAGGFSWDFGWFFTLLFPSAF